jgi:hypothetical protein
MRRDAQRIELGEDEFGDAVVQNALAVDDVVLGAVAGGGVVLEILNQSARLGSLVEVLRLALVNLPPTVHWQNPDSDRGGEVGPFMRQNPWGKQALSGHGPSARK